MSVLSLVACQRPPNDMSSRPPDSGSLWQSTPLPGGSAFSAPVTLSYISQGDILQIDPTNPTSSPEKLTNSGRAIRYGWSPNGQALWYEEPGGRLIVLDTATGRTIEMPGEMNANASWSPDSSALVYVSYLIADWLVDQSTYGTELHRFDLERDQVTTLVGSMAADRLLAAAPMPPVGPPIWQLAHPLFVDEQTILLIIISQSSLMGTEPVYFNFLATLDVGSGELRLLDNGDLSQGDPLSVTDLAMRRDVFITDGIPLAWQLAADGRTLSIAQPFSQKILFPPPPSGFASALWAYDWTTLSRRSLIPSGLACDEILMGPAAWGTVTGMAWQHLSFGLAVSFQNTRSPESRGDTACGTTGTRDVYWLAQEDGEWRTEWTLPGSLEPAWSPDDRLLAYTVAQPPELGSSMDTLLPPAVALIYREAPDFLVRMAKTPEEPWVKQAARDLLASSRFRIEILDQKRHAVFVLPHAHSPAWRPDPGWHNGE